MLSGRDRTVVSVGVVVLVAVLVRVVGLGTRPFHWDEARVGYWTLRSLETGSYSYRPVAGGPLVYLLARLAMTLGTASDFLARLPIALLSGLLPAAALLFRGRLRDDETVGLALLLAFSPLLLYYGRFLRGDLLAAGAALVAVGFLLRWVDTDRDGFLYAATVSAVAALAASGFAVATLVLVVVAGLFTVDRRRIEGKPVAAREAIAVRGGWLRERLTPLARALFVFLGAWAVAFAPRGYGALSDPVGFLLATYRTPVVEFLAVRVSGREGTELLPFLTDAAGTLLATSVVVFALGVAGFLLDRYEGLPAVESPRRFVAFAGFWAGLGLIGYPIVAAVTAPWTLVHAIVPMTVPAAVGLAALVRYGRRALSREDAARATTALLVLAVVAGGVGVVALDGVAGEPAHDDGFSQYGQPVGDLEPLVEELTAALSTSDDDRVVYVGERFHLADEAAVAHPPITDPDARTAFGERLPLPWYVERTDATSASVADPADIDGEPAVMIVDSAHEGTVADRYPDHETMVVETALYDREVVVFLDAG